MICPTIEMIAAVRVRKEMDAPYLLLVKLYSMHPLSCSCGASILLKFHF